MRWMTMPEWKRCRRILWVALVAATVGAAACGRVIEAPEVRVTSVRLGGVGLEGGLLYVGLTVDNPNGFGLEASRFVYQLELAEPGTTSGEATWTDLAADTLNRTLSFPANDSTTIELPIRFTYRGVGSALRSLIRTGTFDYRIRGSITLVRPVPWEFPFRQTGTISGI